MLCLNFILFIDQKYLLILFKNKFFNKETISLKIKPFYELFNITIQKNIILIIEPNIYHHECTPGYSKYFIELGYNVDILLHKSGIDSFCSFSHVEKIRIFSFINRFEIEKCSFNLSSIIRKYDFILLETTDKDKKNLYINLGLLNLNNSIFVFHDVRFIYSGYLNYLNQNRVWTLGNFPNGLRVNPHYFGDIRLRDKNNKTRFFMTSTPRRNYQFFVECMKKLKENKYDFEIFITGRSNAFNSKRIPYYLTENFIFKHKVSYSELYLTVQNSDYIIIFIDPNDRYGKEYKTIKVSGSIQLVYGFLKPPLIHQGFTDFYNLDNKNSLIYNDSNFYNIMEQAILLDNKKYKKIQSNLQIIEKKIHKTSIDNIKKIVKK